MNYTPCPICGQMGGFHTNPCYSYERVPEELTWSTAKAEEGKPKTKVEPKWKSFDPKMRAVLVKNPNPEIKRLTVRWEKK